MTSFELIWRLILLLLSTYKDKNPENNEDFDFLKIFEFSEKVKKLK